MQDFLLFLSLNNQEQTLSSEPAHTNLSFFFDEGVENNGTLTALHMKAFSEHPSCSWCRTTTARIIRELYFENIGLHGNEGTTLNQKPFNSAQSAKELQKGE